MGRKFGDPADPLLVSVRSGAAGNKPILIIYFIFIFHLNVNLPAIIF